MQVELFRVVEALGPFAAMNADLVAPFLARTETTAVATRKGMPLYQIDGGTAIIDIEGPLAGKADFFWGILFMDGYDRILQAVQIAAKDQEVDSILFRINSPGGQAQGLSDAADEIRATLDAAGKPSVASMSLAASAGYWLASVADEQYVDKEGAAGSIGTYTSHYDYSRALDKAGITITHIQDPEGKTSGTWTKPLDEEAKARLQEVVSMLSQSFYGQVSNRRKITPAAVRDLNAKMFYGQKAVDSKLADGVLSFSAAKKRAGELAQKRKKEQMSELASFLGLDPKASAEDIKKAADEAKPVLGLGRMALSLTGEKSADAAKGVLVSWQKDSGDAAVLRENAAKNAADQDAKTRHDLLVALAQKEPPAQVWQDTSDLSKGPLQYLADMTTTTLQTYVKMRTSGKLPAALQTLETEAKGALTDEQVKAFAKANGIKNLEIAKHALMTAQEGSV